MLPGVSLDELPLLDWHVTSVSRLKLLCVAEASSSSALLKIVRTVVQLSAVASSSSAVTPNALATTLRNALDVIELAHSLHPAIDGLPILLGIAGHDLSCFLSRFPESLPEAVNAMRGANKVLQSAGDDLAAIEVRASALYHLAGWLETKESPDLEEALHCFREAHALAVMVAGRAGSEWRV